MPADALEGEPCVGGSVRYEDRYYVVEGGRSIVWANPAMLVSLGGLVGAVGISVAVFRREMGSRPW